MYFLLMTILDLNGSIVCLIFIRCHVAYADDFKISPTAGSNCFRVHM